MISDNLFIFQLYKQSFVMISDFVQAVLSSIGNAGYLSLTSASTLLKLRIPNKKSTISIKNNWYLIILLSHSHTFSRPAVTSIRTPVWTAFAIRIWSLRTPCEVWRAHRLRLAGRHLLSHLRRILQILSRWTPSGHWWPTSFQVCC